MKRRQKNDGVQYRVCTASIYHKTTRKKNLGFLTKCGFEINKEIKGNEAEK